MRQDSQLVDEILEYRALKAGRDLIAQGEKGTEALKEHPGLVALMREVRRAQVGEDP